MSGVHERDRPNLPIAGVDIASVLESLERQREILAWKTWGLDDAVSRVTVGKSTITLGGLLKHLARVEDYWFSNRLRGNEMALRWARRGLETDPDWDWHPAADESHEQLHVQWREAVAHSRAHVADALAEGGLDVPALRPWTDGEGPTLRWIMMHMIEEYARHNGHADLIRESVHWLVGENPKANSYPFEPPILPGPG